MEFIRMISVPEFYLKELYKLAEECKKNAFNDAEFMRESVKDRKKQKLMDLIVHACTSDIIVKYHDQETNVK